MIVAYQVKGFDTPELIAKQYSLSSWEEIYFCQLQRNSTKEVSSNQTTKMVCTN